MDLGLHLSINRELRQYSGPVVALLVEPGMPRLRLDILGLLATLGGRAGPIFVFMWRGVPLPSVDAYLCSRFCVKIGRLSSEDTGP